jgi:molybdopterin synthase catalytic subunit
MAEDIPSAPVAYVTEDIHIELTPYELDSAAAIRFTRSPSAGATTLFIGSTRDTFDNKTVSNLEYTAYIPRAIRTLTEIAESKSFANM